VIGVLPGILGSLQANEVIKVLSGVGDPLSGRLFIFDAASFQTRTLKIGRSASNPLNGEHPTQTELIDYEQFCGLKTTERKEDLSVREVAPGEYAAWLQQGEPITLIDVREPYEYEIANLGGTLAPLGSLEDCAGTIPREGKVVVHCRSGVRSARAIKQLEDQFGFNNLYNLKGGILAYAEEIDTSLAKY
jgi:adenylyltransferase/sulfurtransferase